MCIKLILKLILSQEEILILCKSQIFKDLFGWYLSCERGELAGGWRIIEEEKEKMIDRCLCRDASPCLRQHDL